jgi:cAMP phosphodiesterase
MEVKILGAFGGEAPGLKTSCIVINNRLALDAGALTSSLSLQDQAKINAILVSHTHLDHIHDISFLADNIFGKRKEPVIIVSMEKSIEVLQKHFLNNRIWPDFTKLPNADQPVLAYKAIKPGQEYKIEGLNVRAVPVNHSIPSVGFIISDDKSALVYTGDTGPTDQIWKDAEKTANLKLVLIEVSFPNEMQKLAEVTGHFTPRMAEEELKKLQKDGYEARAFHLKPTHLKELKQELARTRPKIVPVEQGEVIQI